MKAAYYSRNRSYSRSANAESAESDGRFPRTRAAQSMGISVKAFDAGCLAANYTTSEWHHVGKYANKVDYYDTAELELNIKFWQGARTKLNRTYTTAKIADLIRGHWQERLMELVNVPVKSPKFANALAAKCKDKGRQLKAIVDYIGSRSGGGPWVTYGVHTEESIRFRRDGSHYFVTESNCASGAFVPEFHLTAANIAAIVTAASKYKQAKHESYRAYYSKCNRAVGISFDREIVSKILDRYVRGKYYNNSITSATPADNVIAGKIIQKLYGDKFEVDFKNGGTYIRAKPQSI